MSSSNTSATYTLHLNSNVSASLRQTEKDALRLDGIMNNLNHTLRMFGMGFAGHILLDASKEWVDGAANYEDAVNRIRFASENLTEGARNVEFIRKEVEKFKIPLQQATDDYGAFLAMIQGSGIGIDKVQELHDQLLLISKIKHLDAGQLSAGVMNLGKMLEAGAMDARHLRPLEMQLSGIGKFIADEMGVSIHELAKLRNQGKLTDVDPMVLLAAVEKQAASLESHLPEAIQSTRSEINELSNEWLEFKNDTVLSLKPELIELFHTFEGGIHWLQENRNTIIQLGGAIKDIVELWIKYKIAMFAWGMAVKAYDAIQYVLYGNTLKQTTAIGTQQVAYKKETIAVNELIAAVERLNYVQNAQNGRFLTNAAGMTMANTAGNRYASSMMAQQMAQQQQLMSGAFGLTNVMAAQNARNIANSGALGMFGRAGNALASVGKAVAPVAVVFMAADIISRISDSIQKDKEYKNATPDERFEIEKNSAIEQLKDLNSFWNKFQSFEKDKQALETIIYPGSDHNKAEYSNISDIAYNHPEMLKDPAFVGEVRRLLEIHGDSRLIQIAKELGYVLDDERAKMANYFTNLFGMFSTNSVVPDISNWAGFPYASGVTKDKTKKEDGHGDFKFNSKDLNSNRIKGNSITNIELHIGEINGMKNPSFAVKSNADMENIKKTVGDHVARILTDAANDAQQVVK